MPSRVEARQKRLAALGAKRVVDTPEDDARMSAVILQLAEPLFKKYGTTAERVETIITLTIASWNKLMFPVTKRAIVEKEIIDGFVPKDGSAEAVGMVVYIMETVAERRERLFPDLRKVIVDHDVEISGDSLNLNVTSAPIPSAWDEETQK